MTKAPAKAAAKKAAPSKDKKPKAIKPVKSKAEEKAPKIAPAKAAAGHNSGGINQPLKDIFEQYELYEANKKQISKAQRDLRAKAKEEHGVLSGTFSDEIRLRKLDSDVRIQREQGLADLKVMLGYQFAMNLVPAAPAKDAAAESEKKPTELVKAAAPTDAPASKGSFFKKAPPAEKPEVAEDDENEFGEAAYH